ncbi:MAG: PilN domain-containing protein [Piscirickettsiaceae bacterium]|nr:PilN domain-containing protein [Piscirickettsiaceae bacterium]
MAHINLLPWREDRRQQRQQQFITIVVAGFIFAALVLYGAILFIDGLIDEQSGRNTFLKSEITVLDKKIKEISALEQERERLLARMQVIQELQASRSKVVKVFDSLVRTVPEGIHLEKVTRQGNSLTLNGVAQSNARVSVFMRQLDEDAEFNRASSLQVIERTSTKARGKGDVIRKFTVDITESKPKTEDGEI